MFKEIIQEILEIWEDLFCLNSLIGEVLGRSIKTS